MKRHRWPNKGGTTTELSVPLALKRREASRIRSGKWHERKKLHLQAWKNNDVDSLILLGTVNRELIERRREKGMPTISKGPRFDKINPWHKRGLGPQGRVAIQRASQALSTAPVTDPRDELTNPANIVVNEPLPENETMPQDWRQFSSSRIASAGYDRDSQRLYVLFHKPYPGGTAWTYHGVPANVWRNLQRSASAGRFVNRVLNNYRYNPGHWG